MADHATTTKLSRWDATLLDYETGKAAWDAVIQLPESGARSRVFDVVEDARRALFDRSAPTLDAVVDKLELFWGDQLLDTDDFAQSYKRKILGDIRRIQLLHTGVEGPDASGGMDLEQVAADWANGLHDYNQHAQLLEAGPSDRWQNSKRSDIVALMDEAEATVLSIHAPNLAAVIRKLELLWADDRFDPVSHSADHCRIVRDLHRLECQTAS